MIYEVKITLPDGKTETGTIVNNKTVRKNGVPLPINSVVHTLDGDYLVTATGSKRVTSVDGFAEKTMAAHTRQRFMLITNSWMSYILPLGAAIPILLRQTMTMMFSAGKLILKIISQTMPNRFKQH